MDRDEALRVLGLPTGGDSGAVDARAIRKAYLRRALEVHPDKRSTAGAEVGGDGDEAFLRVRRAYEVALRGCQADGTDGIDGVNGMNGMNGDDDEIMEMDDILVRAFRGEDVREALERRGGWRPGDDFGIDLEARWGATDVEAGGCEAGGCEAGGWRDELEAGLAVDDEDDDVSHK